MPKYNLINSLLYLFYLGFLFSTVAGFRAYSSIGIGLIVITSFIYNKKLTGAWCNKGLRNRYVIFCSLFFLLQIIPLAYTHKVSETLKHIQVKSALLFIPLCFFCCTYVNKVTFYKLMKAYVFILAMLLTWCLAISCIKYQFHHAGPGIFFYHELVSDLGQHAIQFSILVFAGMIFLLQEITHNRYLINRRIHLLLLTYLIGGILLLSSKLVISFTLCCLAYYAFISLKKNIDTHKAIALVAIVGIGISCMVLFTRNPISSRFADIMHDNLTVLHQKTFNQAVYFNGVQFRLLQWRFVKEIIQEHHAWLLGVTPANAQALLDQKYVSANMYAGTPGTNDRGYLIYNTHNQFLESFLQSGLIGLIVFLGICSSMIIMAVQQKSRMLRAMVLLLLAYCFSESVLETQYGLIVFLFLPLFFAPHPLQGES
jgi:hypothetical protein